jgi:hypothetical protein
MITSLIILDSRTLLRAVAPTCESSRPGFFTPGEGSAIPPHVKGRPFILYLGQREARKNLGGMLEA